MSHAFRDVASRDSHRSRHQLLRDCFTELLDDFLSVHPRRAAQSVTAEELLHWAGHEAVDPTEDEDGRE